MWVGNCLHTHRHRGCHSGNNSTIPRPREAHNDRYSAPARHDLLPTLPKQQSQRRKRRAARNAASAVSASPLPMQPSPLFKRRSRPSSRRATRGTTAARGRRMHSVRSQGKGMQHVLVLWRPGRTRRRLLPFRLRLDRRTPPYSSSIRRWH